MEKVKFQNVLKVTKSQVLKNRWTFIEIFIVLSIETLLALLMPQILSEVLDNLSVKSNKWLAAGALAFCITVLIRGAISIWNTYLSEKLGWKFCDYLRKDIFRIIFVSSVSLHKKTKAGEFLERIEGDINILVGFFSSMFVDIIGSILMVGGILVVFCFKSSLLGIIFFVISGMIVILFVKTQNGIANLWSHARAAETQVLGEFVQDIQAYRDVVGMKKEKYIMDRFDEKFNMYEKPQVMASFLGNIPSTIFYSLLNVGEGIVLAIGFFLMKQGKLTIGNMYLILSYVGLLNVPFFNLKYEFAQLPKVLAAIERVNYIYNMEDLSVNEGTKLGVRDGKIVFENVSFSYEQSNLVLKHVNFSIHSGEKVLIEGRTGSGKSTILQLIAGLYEPQDGKIRIGGHEIKEYQIESYNQSIYYIFQSNPIINDTIMNNISRYHNQYSNEEVVAAIQAVKLENWFKQNDKTLDTEITSEDLSHDEAQLLAWAGALLAKPKILLVDEFDASISDNVLHIVDKLIEDFFAETTIIMVSHKLRSRIGIQRKMFMNAGNIAEITAS